MTGCDDEADKDKAEGDCGAGRCDWGKAVDFSPSHITRTPVR